MMTQYMINSNKNVIHITPLERIMLEELTNINNFALLNNGIIF